MRLTCPTCGAEYEIADAMVPSAGRHVQCTACHTRWFARGAVPRQESEDEIMRRLEARSHLRAVPAPAREPQSAAPDQSRPDQPESDQPRPDQPISEPPAETATGTEPPATGAEAPLPSSTAAAPFPPPAAATPRVSAPSEPQNPAASPRVVPAKPAERPMAASDSLTLRPAPRLDLAEPRPLPPPPQTPAPSRFGAGLLVAIVIFGAALGTYLWRAQLSAAVPAAAPALGAYGRFVDDLRLKLDERIDAFRNRGAEG